MTPADKGARFERWFSGMVERRLADRFAEVRVHGLDTFRASAEAGGVILVANHSAWWDPMMAIWLGRLTGVDSYAVMNGANLGAHAYFSRVGAIGVDLEDPRDGARFLRYAKRLLETRDPGGRALWIFAQGEERPAHERPLHFRPGAAALARLSPNTRSLPVALRYTFAKWERPVAHLSIGAPLELPRARAEAVAAQVSGVEAEFDRIEADLVAGLPEDGAFVRHLVHQPSFTERVAPRLLSRWLAPRRDTRRGQEALAAG